MTNAKILEAVQNSVSSIFTKDDIIKLLTTETEVTNPTEADEDVKAYSKADLRRVFDGAVSLIKDQLSGDLNISEDWVDLYSAGFSLSGNEVNLESVDLDENEIRRQINDCIDEIDFDENFESLITIA